MKTNEFQQKSFVFNQQINDLLDNKKQTKKQTFGAIFSQKACKWLEESSMKKISKTWLIYGIFPILIAISVNYPLFVLGLIWQVLSAFNYALLILSVFYFALFFKKPMLKKIKEILNSQKNDRLFNVPKTELVDYLFDLQERDLAFSRESVCNKFAINRGDFMSLMSALEKVDLLHIDNSKGKVRKVSDKYTRQEVADIIFSANKNKLMKPIKIFSGGRQINEAKSKEQIQDNLRHILDENGDVLFTIRPLRA